MNTAMDTLSDIEILISTMKKIEIKHVYSFDDDWGNKPPINKEILQKDIAAYVSDIGEELSQEDEESLLENELYTVGELINSQMESYNHIREKIQKFLYKKRDIKELEILDSLLDKLKEEGITYKKFSKKLEYEDIKGIEGRILFLLDMNMEKIGEGKDVILESLIEINKMRNDKLDIAIVYSHETLSHYENHNSKTKYIENNLQEYDKAVNEFEKYLLAHQLWAVTKQTEEAELIHSLNDVLSKAIFGKSLYNFLKAKVRLLTETVMELIQFSENDFSFLLKDALVEGESLLRVLNRIEKSVLNKKELISKTIDTEYIDSIENLLEAVNIINKEVIESLQEVNKIDQFRKVSRKTKFETGIYKNISEYGLVDYSVNRTYEDLSTGDIFKLILKDESDYCYGILITANCDIPIRFGKKFSEGLRRNEETMSLLLYKPHKIEDLESKIIEDKSDKYIWPINEVQEDDQTSKSIALEPINKVIQINSKLLDACTINNQGEAGLNVDEEFQKYKTYNFLQYFNNDLRNWLQEVESIEHYIEKKELLSSLEGIENMYVELLAGYKYNVKMDAEKKKFCINRIGKLDSGYSLKLVQNHANKIGRIGVESVPFA